MNWTTNDNEPEAPEVFYRSSCDGQDNDEILFDLWIVTQRMAERREAEGAAGATRLHLFSNATNGYVDLAWLDAEQAPLGRYRYTLFLPGLHQASLEHEDGAFHFDRQVRFAAFSLAEDLICLQDEGDGLREGESERALYAKSLAIPAEDWEIYASNELETELEEIIA